MFIQEFFKQKPKALAYILATVISCGILVFFFVHTANATTYTWDGGGGDNNFSTCANWSSNTCPTSSDSIIFDGTNTKDATIDSAWQGTVVSFSINSGYTGTITQNRSLTVGTNGSFSQAAGTFVGSTSSDAILLNLSSFSLSNGTFTSTNGTFTVHRNFTITSGTFNNGSGTVAFDDNGNVSNSGTLSCNNATFNRVTANKTQTTLTVGSNCTLPISATSTNNGGTIINNGTINFTATSSLYIGGAYTQNSGATTTAATTTLSFNGDLTLNGGTFPTTITSLSITFGGLILNQVTSPTFTALSTLSIQRNLDNSANKLNNGIALTVWDNGNVSNSSTITCGTITWGSVTLTKIGGTVTTVNSTCVLPISGTSISTGAGLTNNGTINSTATSSFTISGPYTQSSASSTLTMATTTLTVVGNLVLDNGTFPTTLTSMDIQFGNLTLNQSTSPAFTSLSTLQVQRNFDNSANKLNNGINLTFWDNGNVSNSTTLTACGNATFNSLVINKTNTSFTLSSDCTISGSFTRTNGSVSNPGSAKTFYIGGDATISTSASFAGTNLTLEMNGTSTQNISSAITLSTPLRVNKTSGDAKLSADLNISTSNCTVAQGNFNLNGKGFTCGGTFRVNSSGTLKLFGSETPTTPTLDSGSTVMYTGDGDGAADSYNFQNWTYSNLTASSTDANDSFGGGVDSLQSNLLGYWALDETTATTSTDSSGSGANGTPVGSGGFNNLPQPTTSVPSVNFTDTRSRNFDGTDDYFTIPSTFSANLGNNMTISAWVKLDTPAEASAYRAILSEQYSGDGNVQYEFFADGSNHNLSAGFYDGSWHQVSESSAFPLNQWVQVITTYDGQYVRLYRAGTQVATSSAFNLSLPVGTNGWYIGRRHDTFGSGNFWRGSIDELRIYNKVLSASDISRLSGGYNTNPLVGPSTISVNNFTLVSGIVTPPNTFNVAGNYSQTGGTYSAATSTLNLTGNFAHSGGTFTASTSAVVFNGANQTISGSTTFNNLTKSVSSAATLTFTAGTTQTLTGTLTLNGTNGNLLSLRSSSNGSQWSIDPQGTRTLSYLDVKDSNNINSVSIITSGFAITDSGGNTNWNFPDISSGGGGTIYPPPITPPSGSFTVQINDGAQTTNTSQVSLTFNALSDVVLVKLSDNSGFYNSQTIDYATTVNIDLCSLRVVCLPGIQVVYAQLINIYGLNSPTIHDSIELISSNAQIPDIPQVPPILPPQSRATPPVTSGLLTFDELLNFFQGQSQGLTIPNTPIIFPSQNSRYKFDRNLSFGMRGEDVRELQIFLNNHGSTISFSGPGSPGNETVIYGYATRSAVLKFQKSNNIPGANGVFGPLTRGLINSILGY